MISTNISSVSARNRLLGWGMLMAIVYAVFLFFFPLFPNIHQPDRVFDIEMLLKDGRKWFAPYYVLGLAVLFLAYWRSLKIVHTLSKEHILMYYILWRWALRKWDWGVNGPLKGHWAYWLIMTWLTVPWTFGIPILGPWLRRRKDRQAFDNTLWI